MTTPYLITYHCRYCQTVFTRQRSWMKSGQKPFCSRVCSEMFRHANVNQISTSYGLSWRAAFWAKVALAPAPACWEWQAASMGQAGYGRFHVPSYATEYPEGAGKTHYAHRVAFFLQNDYLRSDLQVCHSCDNVQCVNPHHLWLGTADDNRQDARRKGRVATGIRNGRHTHPESILRGQQHKRAKFLDTDISDIRYLAACGMPRRVLASIYNVHKTTILHIVKAETWQHI